VVSAADTRFVMEIPILISIMKNHLQLLDNGRAGIKSYWRHGEADGAEDVLVSLHARALAQKGNSRADISSLG